MKQPNYNQALIGLHNYVLSHNEQFFFGNVAGFWPRLNQHHYQLFYIDSRFLYVDRGLPVLRN